MSSRYRPLAFLLLLLSFVAAPLSAQTARVQVIHNSPDPAAAIVDIYIDDALTLDDVPFRGATGFLDLPAGTEFSVGIAPGSSTGPGDILASFAYTLAEGEVYQLIATGVLDPSQFADNPDGEDTAFTLLVNTPAREVSTDAGQVQFNVVHGSPDAPTVDIAARGVGTLVDDAVYTAITDYLTVPATEYQIDVKTADGSTTVASFTAPLTGAEGAALTVLASGFLDPSANQSGPAFGLLAVFADGMTVLLPNVTSNEGTSALPDGFQLQGNYPNPFNPSTTIRFDLPVAAEVSVSVFDTLGRRVLDTPTQAFEAGPAQALRLDAGALASGAYVYRVTARSGAASFSETGRFALVK